MLEHAGHEVTAADTTGAGDCFVGALVFARHLNVPTGLVTQWERGEKRPRAARSARSATRPLPSRKG